MVHLQKLLIVLFITLPFAALAQDKPAAPPKPTPEVQKLIDAGFAAIQKYDWTAALKQFENASDTAQKNHDAAGQALALHYQGSIYTNLAQNQKALALYGQAIPLYQQVGDKNGEANALGGIAAAYNNIGQVKKSLDYYGQSLAIYRQVGIKPGEATILALMGRGYLRIGQPQKALDTYQEGLALFKQLGDTDGEARSLTSIGGVYDATSQPQKALDFYGQALPLHKQTGNKFAEADTLNNIGLVLFGIGQPQKALENYGQAAQLYKQTGNVFGEANTRTNIGIVYERLGQPQKALDIYRQCLRLYKQGGSKSGEASALGNIGNTYVQRAQFHKALEFQQQALALYKQTGDKSEQAQTLTNIGLNFINKGQSSKAFGFLNQALQQYKGLKDGNGTGRTLANLGTAHFQQKQYSQALTVFQQALIFIKQAGDKSGEARTLASIGNTFVHLGSYPQAENALQTAVLLMEQLRGAIGGGAQNRQTYLATVLPAYTDLVRVQVQRKETARAFATLNKIKARSLLDQGQHTRRLLTTLPAEESASLRKRWREVDALSLAFVAAERRGKAARQAAQERLQIAERTVQLEQDALAARYPEATAQEARTLSLADVPKFLPPDTALLEYLHVVPENEADKKRSGRVLLFVVTTQQGKPNLTIHSLSASQTELANLAEPFRQACASPKRAYKPLARKLALLLLPPAVQKRLIGKKRLVICPDGVVWSVPFAALVLPNGKHLLEQYEIDYAYSATGAQAALTAPQTHAEGMLVLANPDFGDTSRFGNTLPKHIAEGKERPLSDPARPLSDPSRPLFEPSRLASILERGKIKPLPGTQREANTLAKFSANITLLAGKEAQESALVKELPKYRYLHFATHGLFSDVSPLQSAIVLAAPLKGSEDDGFLTAREIGEMKLNAEMAVLSACETARGVNTEGEGVVGLTWALFAAGVPTQVVSQWKVSDASTPQLMERLYSNLKQGRTKGRALQQAAISMLKDGKHSHPYHWAAFVLFGSWK